MKKNPSGFHESIEDSQKNNKMVKRLPLRPHPKNLHSEKKKLKVEEGDGGGWSQLPYDLLAHIANRLGTLSDTIRFGAVCRNWGRVALQGEGNFSSPCILPSLALTYSSDTGAFRSYSPFNQDLQVLFIQDYAQEPDLPDRLGASIAGWLLQIRYHLDAVELINPLLQRRIQMPPLISSLTDRESLFKAAISCRGGGAVLAVMVMIYPCGVLFARPGDRSWTKQHFPSDYYGTYFDDIIHHNQQFHALTQDGRLVAFKEIKGGGSFDIDFIVKQPPSLGDARYNLFLVESSRGELLLVVCHYFEIWVGRSDPQADYHDRLWYEIFRLEHNTQGSLSWLEVKSLGEDSLFLSKYTSASVTAAASRGCQKNCIYVPGENGIKDTMNLLKRKEWILGNLLS